MDNLPELLWLQVSPTRRTAVITYPDGKDHGLSEFTFDGKLAPKRIPGMYVAVSLFEGCTLLPKL